jgi:hypothetical protein
MTVDRLTLAGMALGVALMLQPWWASGFSAGFFITLVSTTAQIAVAHRAPPDRVSNRDSNREPDA